MPRKVRDWNKLKLDFFKDEIDDVSVFFKTRYGQRNGTININTRWRSRDKQDFKKEIAEKALAKAKEKMSDDMALDLDKIRMLKKRWFELLFKRANDFIDKKDKNWNIIQWEKVDVRDIKDIINLSKVEMWEPTTISRGDADSQREPITIVIKGIDK